VLPRCGRLRFPFSHILLRKQHVADAVVRTGD
jgi:hypothetical protein